MPPLLFKCNRGTLLQHTSPHTSRQPFVPTQGIDGIWMCSVRVCYLFWNVKLLGRKKRAETSSCTAAPPPSLSCLIDRETAVNRGKWGSSNTRQDFVFFPHGAKAQSVVFWCNTSDSTFHSFLQIDFICSPNYLFIHFLYHFLWCHFCRDYPKLCVWTEPGTRWELRLRKQPGLLCKAIGGKTSLGLWNLFLDLQIAEKDAGRY